MERRQARELAMKALYQADLVGTDAVEALVRLAEDEGATDGALSFARELVKGCLERVEEIDRLIREHARAWRLERLAYVDRNIIRVAVYEILHRPDIPASVSINEAVELAKVYGGADTPKFVNGILGQVARDLSAHSTGPEEA